MLYSLLANLVLIVHGVFVLFVATGGLLVLKMPRLLWLHLPALGWGGTVVGMGWVCPLTPLENHLRRLAGRARLGIERVIGEFEDPWQRGQHDGRAVADALSSLLPP